ncbi:MAG: hypothetical protein R3A79_02600 [Nannocystaceae bacterium]
MVVGVAGELALAEVMDERDVLEGVRDPEAEVADDRAVDDEDAEEGEGRQEEEQARGPRARAETRPPLVPEPAQEDRDVEAERPCEDDPRSRSAQERTERPQEQLRVAVAGERLGAEDEDDRRDREDAAPQQGEVAARVGPVLDRCVRRRSARSRSAA